MSSEQDPLDGFSEEDRGAFLSCIKVSSIGYDREVREDFLKRLFRVVSPREITLLLDRSLHNHLVCRGLDFDSKGKSVEGFTHFYRRSEEGVPISYLDSREYRAMREEGVKRFISNAVQVLNGDTKRRILKSLF